MKNENPIENKGTLPAVLFIVFVTAAILFKVWIYLFASDFQITGEIPCKNGESCFVKDCTNDVCLTSGDDGLFYYKKFTAHARTISEQCTDTSGFLSESCVDSFCGSNAKSCQIEYCSGEECQVFSDE